MTVLYYEIKEMLKKQIVLHKRGIALYTRTNSRSHSLIGLSWNGRSNTVFLQPGTPLRTRQCGFNRGTWAR